MKNYSLFFTRSTFIKCLLFAAIVSILFTVRSTADRHIPTLSKEFAGLYITFVGITFIIFLLIFFLLFITNKKNNIEEG